MILYELHMPDVVLCVTLFGVEMAVILIELPFICAYFWKSPVVHVVYVRTSCLPVFLIAGCTNYSFLDPPQTEQSQWLLM